MRRLSWLSNVSLAILLGVGVAVALGGAVLGTLVPQVSAATTPAISEPPIMSDVLEPLGRLVAIIGTAAGLTVFSFTSGRPTRRLVNRLLNRGSRIGHWFIMIGFGAAYGGVLVASLSFFADRVQYLIEVLEKISGG
jgi:hypothetical protein